MSDLMPFILAEEQAKKNFFLKVKISLSFFDGTTRLGEAMTVLVHFVNSEWIIQQQLLRMQMLSKSMTGEEIAR